MVARYVRDVEAASSSLATPTITYFPHILATMRHFHPLGTDLDLTVVRKACALAPLVRCPMDGKFDPCMLKAGYIKYLSGATDRRPEVFIRQWGSMGRRTVLISPNSCMSHTVCICKDGP